ncbi:hypothetical protein SCP_1002740 [Sparassis crispa]|uniref:SMP domain-containing protein n=1 Tax=Sparassis crispa TaxID=139825 RepID=A0A401GXT0_9APHY|nr:hypothetical protein SCP_1002740 [Sparassis crispa]GBE87028.1 hypothetical protein SCP_1002740 [Sparassis crispa]
MPIRAKSHSTSSHYSPLKNCGQSMSTSSTGSQQGRTSPEVPLIEADVLSKTSPPAPVSSTPRSSGASVALAEGVDLTAIGKAEARKIMSEEHRILRFRPPQGSLAAEAQAAAAKHPDGRPDAAPPDTLRLKALARKDAERILAERKMNTEGATADADGKRVEEKHTPATEGVNLSTISAVEARTLMSHEHRALGFRPPPGSIAAEAQAAAARHPEGDGVVVDKEVLKEIAIKDAERIKADRELDIVGEANVSTFGRAGARTVVSGMTGVLRHSPEASAGLLVAEAACVHPEGANFPQALDGEAQQVAEAEQGEAELSWETEDS